MRWPALAAVLAAAAILIFSVRGTWLTAMGLALAAWVVVGLSVSGHGDEDGTVFGAGLVPRRWLQ